MTLCSERNAGAVLAYGLHHISLFFCLKSLHESFSAELRRWNVRPQNNVKRTSVWKCKETICSTKCDMHWKTHDCNGKWTCLKRISTSFVFLVKIIEEETSVHIMLQMGKKIKRYCGCIGASPLPVWLLFIAYDWTVRYLFVRQPR